MYSIKGYLHNNLTSCTLTVSLDKIFDDLIPIYNTFPMFLHLTFF